MTNQKAPIENKISGKVVWYNVQRNFGFIRRNDNGKDVFVAQKSLQNWNRAHRVPSLDSGEEVEFRLQKDGDKWRAIEVTGPCGTQLRGSRYAVKREPAKKKSTSTQERRRLQLMTPSERRKKLDNKERTTLAQLIDSREQKSVNVKPTMPDSTTSTSRTTPSNTAPRDVQIVTETLTQTTDASIFVRRPETVDELGMLPFQEEGISSGNNYPLISRGKDQRKETSPCSSASPNLPPLNCVSRVF